MNRILPNLRLPLLWVAGYLIMLVLFLVPVLNLVTINFIMVPVFFLYMAVSRTKFAITAAAAMLAAYLLGGTLGLVLGALPLFFLPSVIAMERMYRKRNLARLAILSGTLTLLAELLVLLVVSKLFGYNLVESLRTMLTDSLVSLPEAWKSMVTPETIDNSVYYVIQSLPVFMIAFCVWYVFVCHAAGRWLLRKTGVTVPALSPVRKWKLPKSLVWYYLAVMILDFMVKPDADPFLFTVVWNLLPLLTFAFAVQALSFLSYVTYHKRKGRFLPAAAVCLTILFPPFIYLFSMVGLFDTMFAIRERFADKS